MGEFQGVIAPIVTPFDDSGTLVTELWVEHAKWVLGQGAHFLSPFGTTGEALSISVKQRMAGLEDLVKAGIEPELLMPGTGLTSIADTVALTKHASELGVRAVMLLPSFFYPDATDAGHFRYFEELLKSVENSKLKICLYNIPQNTGVPISPMLTGRLRRAYPENFMAYKDSTGVWENTNAIIRAAPGMAVFPGTEVLMAKAMKEGGAGCISASVNLNANAIRSVYDNIMAGVEDVQSIKNMIMFRQILQSLGLIPAIKSILAVKYNDIRWHNLKPPLENCPQEFGAKLLNELDELATHITNS